MLANQILDIIRDRRMDPGDRLAEVALAAQLGVSRTPVRGALTLLAREGVVQARPNQGFSLAMGWVELRNTILSGPTSSDDDLYMRIIRDRLAGKLPDSVTQAALIEHFGTKRAVLVKTLGRMAQEGLVAKNKGHGWTFLPTIDTAVSLANSYDFRLAIEPAIFGLDSFKVDMVALDRVRSRHLWLLERGDAVSASNQELFEIDAQFHETLVSFSGNPFFVQSTQQQNRLRRLLEYQGYWNLRRIQTWVREHLEIIDAILAIDLELAQARLRAHLVNAHAAASRLTSSGRAGKPRPTVSTRARRRDAPVSRAEG